MRRSFRLGLLAVLLLAAQCHRAAPQPPSFTGMRLPSAVRPTGYQAKLRVDPARPDFSATIAIELSIAQPTARFWMHAEGLRIRRASILTGATSATVRVTQTAPSLIAIDLPAPLAVGSARLEIEYNGDITRTDEHALFSQEENGRRYAITDMEPVYARRVFPCFDEPSFKAPWQLTLTVPAGNLALSNGPVLRESPADGGWRTIEFAATPPLSSYLIAFAVGPYELVDAGRAGRNQVPIHVAVPAGMSSASAPVARVAGELLERLERWFGTPYPFSKLDLVTIPVSSFAMENAAMITFARHLILPPPSGPSLEFERDMASALFHEMAHQWFGDMVTMSWWDDAWLNEAFATWLSERMLAEWRPQWSQGVGPIDIRRDAMDEDALASARSVRQPIESTDDIFNAFDEITYKKGASVLSMFESFLGASQFHAGVTQYLKQHAWSNASAGDFVAAMSTATGSDLARAWSDFLDRPGTPSLSVAFECGESPRIEWRQSRYVQLGAPPGEPQSWHVPFCVRAQQWRQCVMLSAGSGSVALSQARECPAWILGNAGELGYYRTEYPLEWLARLYQKADLTLPERVGLIDDTRAMVRAGHLSIGEELRLLAPLAAERRRAIVERVIDAVRSVDWTVVTPQLRARFAKWARGLFAPRARALGWRAHEHEDEDTRLLRPELLDVATAIGQDFELAAGARPLVRAYLRDSGSVDSDLIGVALLAAARSGDRALWQRYYDGARAAHDRSDRELLLSGLGAFADPGLIADSLRILETDVFEPREALEIWQRAIAERSSRDQAYDFMNAHFDALAKKLPPELVTQLVGDDVGSLCDTGRRSAAETFFGQRVVALPGGPRELRHALERVDHCVAIRKVSSSSLSAMLPP
jgi:aminopeptidase N